MDNSEIEALQSVYDEKILEICYNNADDTYVGVFKAYFNVRDANFTINLAEKDSALTKSLLPSGSQLERVISMMTSLDSRASVSIEYLPPIMLSFRVRLNTRHDESASHLQPQTWLLEKLVLTSHANWLSNNVLHSKLHKLLVDIARENSEELFLWQLFDVVENQALPSIFPGAAQSSSSSSSSSSGVAVSLAEFLRLTDCVSPPPPAASHPDSVAAFVAENVEALRSAGNRLSFLTDYDRAMRAHHLTARDHECAVCCEWVGGARCVLFSPCAHVFCASCVRHAFTTHIQWAGRYTLTCLQCECPASQSQICGNLDEPVYRNWEKWTLNKCVGEVVECPRAACHTAVTISNSDSSGGGAQGGGIEDETHQINDGSTRHSRLAQCPRCLFAFCVLCRQTYHGELGVCRQQLENKNEQEELLQSGDSEEELSDNNDSDKDEEIDPELYDSENPFIYEIYLNIETIKKISMKCPHCKMPIQRTFGCNQMRCLMCDTNFCYGCGRYSSYDENRGEQNVCRGNCYVSRKLEPNFSM